MSQLPISRGDVEGFLGVTAIPSEQQAMSAAADAASAFAARHALGLTDPLPSTESPVDVSGDVWLGAVMLASRWFGRRNSPSGVAQFSDLGPAYVRSSDPDVAILLGLDRPRVG